MRVLLVEDDVLIGAAMAADVREIGFDPVGPIRSVAEALQVVEVDGIDLAIVDVRLASGNSADLAAVLKARGIPFAWVTGFAASTFPTLGAPVLVKPVSAHRFQRLLTDLVAGGAHRAERTGSSSD
jgi:response regulator of citrate/malate metabolism